MIKRKSYTTWPKFSFTFSVFLWNIMKHEIKQRLVRRRMLFLGFTEAFKLCFPKSLFSRFPRRSCWGILLGIDIFKEELFSFFVSSRTATLSWHLSPILKIFASNKHLTVRFLLQEKSLREVNFEEICNNKHLYYIYICNYKEDICKQ